MKPIYSIIIAVFVFIVAFIFSVYVSPKSVMKEGYSQWQGKGSQNQGGKGGENHHHSGGEQRHHSIHHNGGERIHHNGNDHPVYNKKIYNDYYYTTNGNDYGYGYWNGYDYWFPQEIIYSPANNNGWIYLVIILLSILLITKY